MLSMEHPPLYGMTIGYENLWLCLKYYETPVIKRFCFPSLKQYFKYMPFFTRCPCFESCKQNKSKISSLQDRGTRRVFLAYYFTYSRKSYAQLMILDVP